MGSAYQPLVFRYTDRNQVGWKMFWATVQMVLIVLVARITATHPFGPDNMKFVDITAEFCIRLSGLPLALATIQAARTRKLRFEIHPNRWEFWDGQDRDSGFFWDDLLGYELHPGHLVFIHAAGKRQLNFVHGGYVLNGPMPLGDALKSHVNLCYADYTDQRRWHRTQFKRSHALAVIGVGLAVQVVGLILALVLKPSDGPIAPWLIAAVFGAGLTVVAGSNWARPEFEFGYRVRPLTRLLTPQTSIEAPIASASHSPKDSSGTA